MRVFRLSILIVILVLCIGAGKTGDRLYVLPSWEDLTAGPEGKTLALVLRGTELEVVEEEGDWVKVQVVGWLPRGSATRDRTEPSRASEAPIGVETISKTFRHAVAPETTDKMVIRLRFRNETNRISGGLGEIRSIEDKLGRRVITNVPGKSLSAFSGVLALKDKTGNTIASRDVEIKRRLDSGKSMEWEWILAPEDRADREAALREEDLKGSELQFTTTQVTYTDGSTRTFGEEDER
jgi:hypothetical protein